jgi:glutathione peroxidase
MSAHDFEFAGIDGDTIKLSQFAGKPVLLVNTASECGYTPQYRGLQALWQRYRERGFVVLGIPCNDFGGQEPGTEAEIKSFCASQYKVSFPMTAKSAVLGGNAHPFYKWAAAQPGSTAVPQWNFHKYLIDAKGALAGSFATGVSPDAKALVTAIEAQLTK